MAGGLLGAIGQGLKLGAGVMNPEIYAQQEQERAQAKLQGEQRRQALAQFVIEAGRAGQIPSEQAAKMIKAIMPELAANLPDGAFGPSVETQRALQEQSATDELAVRLGYPKGTPATILNAALRAQAPGKVDNALINLVGPDGRKVTLRRGDPRGDTLLANGYTEYEKPRGPLVSVNNSGETAFDKESAKKLAGLQSDIVSAGELAAGTLPNFAQLSTLLGSGVQTGAVASSTLPLRAFARDLGVDLDASAKALGVNFGDVVSQQDFDRVSRQVIIDGFAKFKGNLNEKEVELAVNAFGNLGRTPEANISAIAAGMAAAQLAAEDGARAIQAQSSADVRALSAERARRGTGRFTQLKKQYEEQIKANRQQAAPTAAGPPAGAPIAESADGRRVYFDGTQWVQF